MEGEAKFVGSFAGSEYLREGVEGDDDPTGGAVDGITKSEVNSPDDGRVGGGLETPPSSAALNWTGLNQNQKREMSKAAYADGALALHDSFVAAGGSGKYDINKLRESLPDWEIEGRALVESYWENVNWM